MQKYGFDDARDVLERASARETAARVAAGALAKALLGALDAQVISHVVALGTVSAEPDRRPKPADLDAVDASPIRCFDADAERAMIAAVEEAAKAGDSLGGVVEILGYGLPPGLGSHVHWDRRIDGLLAQALMSIQAMKGVEIGDGFDVAARRGSEAHDEILWDATSERYERETTRAGGTEGGMTTGDLLVARVAMKPLATLNRPVLRTVDVETKEETVSFKERTDVTAVPRVGRRRRDDGRTGARQRDAPEVRRRLTDRAPAEPRRVPRVVGMTQPPVPRNLVLVGLMGAGKTTVGNLCAARLERPFVDVDEVIEATTGCSVAEIFEKQGEAAFRARERDAIADVSSSPQPIVIACGGGAVLDVENRRRLRANGLVVWLRAAPAELARRLEDPTERRRRPLLGNGRPSGVLEDLVDVRSPSYEAAADVSVDTDGRTVEQVVDAVLAEVARCIG